MLNSQTNNYLHVITGIGLAQRSFSSSSKMNKVIGIDWQQVMLDNQLIKSSSNATAMNQNEQKDSNINQWLRRHMLTHRDLCHVLALETNGSVFNNKALKQAK